MKKYDQIILRFLVLGFPLAVGTMIWAYYIVGNNKTLHADNYNGGWWNLLGIFLIAWLVIAVITLFRLLLNSKFRERILSRVVRVQERDEREMEISGHATKFSFYANLALLVCLLFFSSLNFNFKKYTKDVFDDKGEKKHGQLSMGFGLHTYDEKAIIIHNNQELRELTYNELPVSKTGIIILLIIWQIGMYQLSARRSFKVHE